MSNVKDHVCQNTALGAFSSVHEEDGDVKMEQYGGKKNTFLLIYSQAAFLVSQCLHTKQQQQPNLILQQTVVNKN